MPTPRSSSPHQTISDLLASVAYNVVFRADVLIEGDVREVQKSKLRGVVEALRTDPTVGKPLTGPLMGYRSTRIGGSEARVVYRIIEDRAEVEVIAMGLRKNSEVYGRAARRAT